MTTDTQAAVAVALMQAAAAVPLGWCAPETCNKEMDATIAMAIQKAILALQPKTLEQALAGMVKPLVWRESICPANAVYHAVAPCGTFFIDRVRDGFIVYHDNNLLGQYSTLEAAKSAAQADNVRRCIAPFIKGMRDD